MAEYIQRGKRRCSSCKIETTRKQCPQCGHTTVGSGDWTVRFKTYENGKIVYKRLSNHYKTKKDAEQGMMLFLEQQKLRNSQSQECNHLSFESAYEQFIHTKQNDIKESSVYTLDSMFRNYITPYFKQKNIDQLTKLDYLNWLNALQQRRLSSKYFNEIRCSLQNLLNWVELIYDIPNLLNKLPKAKNNVKVKEMQFYDLEQWKKFQNTIKDDILYDTLFNFQYFMGTRIGETVALSDSDIDFKQNVVHITKSLTRKTKESIYKITTPKNSTSIRDVSMPDIIVKKVKKYLDWKRQNGIASEFLFGGTKPLSDNTYTRRFRYYSSKANLPIIRIHDLRHSHASLLINNGANVMLVSKRLGHSTPTETLNRYAKLFRSAEDEIIKKLNNL